METFLYYLFCAMCLCGGLGVIILRGYVNTAMSMLVSMLGVAGLMFLMQAYFVAILMVSVYAGAVLVLFIFVVMLMGDTTDGVNIWKKLALLALWVAAGCLVGWFAPEMVEDLRSSGPSAGTSVLAEAKNYGTALFTEFMLPFQIVGLLLLAAMVGVIAIAKPFTVRNRNNDMD